MKNKLFLKFKVSFWVSVLVLCSACSCSTEGTIQLILGISAQAPVFMDCKPVSSTEILFTFSDEVQVISLNFDTGLEVESIEEGSEVKVTLAKALAEGRRITADILVEDSNRNTLNVIVPFRARNDRMPALVINEIRTENSKPRAEFVEFFALEPGNLGAMRFFIAGHSLTKAAYEFPPVEVEAGEYIVLHLRTTEEGCVDETGTDLALSRGTDAHNNARDLWIPGNRKLIHKTDALWLIDQDERIIDAVILCENPGEWGRNNSNVAAAAEFLGRERAWLPSSGNDGAWIPSPADAVISAGTTNTRTICRDETITPASPRAGNWYITATSGATPGRPNNVKRHNP